MRYEDAPMWLRAADTHNVAAHGNSMFSDAAEWVGEKFSNIPKAAVTATLSATASFYNTGLAITNVFRPEESKIAYADVGDWAAALDSDLGKYYEENRGFVDTVGFIAGSFIPGLGGVKLLGAGQKALAAAAAGQVGTNMSRATGLLVPNLNIQVQRHAADLAARNATWKLHQAGTLRAIGASAHQGILEGIAFEGMVMATMFQAPVFDEMDALDMIKNMSIGVVFGGGFGAIAGVAKSYFGTSALLKNAGARELALSTKATTLRAAPNIDNLADDSPLKGIVATPEADAIQAAAYDRANLAREVTYEDVKLLKLSQGESGYSISDEAIEAEVKFLNSQREQNLEKLNNTIRIKMRELNKSPAKDDAFGNTVADVFSRLEPSGMYSLLGRARQFVRAGEESLWDKAARAYAKENKVKLEEAKAALGPDTSVHVRVHSGKFGDVLEELPQNSLRLADQFTPKKLWKEVAKARHTPSKSQKIFTKGEQLTQAFINKAESRWIWSRTLAAKTKLPKAIETHDLPLMKLAAERASEIVVVTPSGETLVLSGKTEILAAYRQAQKEVMSEMLKAGANPHQIEIVTDIRADYLQGAPTRSLDDPLNFSAQESYVQEFNEFTGHSYTLNDLAEKPRFMKLSYAQEVTDEEGMVLKGMQGIKYQQKLYQEAADRAVQEVLGPVADNFVPFTEEAMRRAWRGGSGQSFVGNAGGAYGSFESLISVNGNITSKAEQQVISALKQRLEVSSQILLKDSDTAIKFSVINEIIAGQAEKFVINEERTGLIPRKIRDWEAKVLAGEDVAPPDLAPGTRDFIPIDSENLLQVIEDHIAVSAARNEKFQKIAAVQGNASVTYADTFYPVRQDPRQFKHVAFVIDDTMTGVGHKRMVLGRSAEDLEQQLSKVPSQYRVVRKGQAEEFHKAMGDWNYDRTLHENYLDSELVSRGIRSNFFPMTDPQLIADTYLQHHVRYETAMFKEAVRTKFAPVLDELERRGMLYAGTHESSTDHISKLEVSSRNNPYMAQAKGLLNISRIEDMPDWWMTSQKALDKTISMAWNRATDVFRNAKLTTDEKIDQVNEIFEKLGFRSAYWGAAEQVFANSRVPRGALSKFIRTSNAFLTNTILRWDPFNALNNKLGNAVIMSGELQSLLKGISDANPAVAGELANLAKITVPGSGGATILSPHKLIAKAYADLSGKNSEAIWKELHAKGLVPDIMDQHRKGIDALTITGAETVKDLESKTQILKDTLSSWGDTLGKATGNEWAERWNRAASAMVMKNITDIAVREGIISSAEAWAYINTFVNRVNGTIRAAERPLMFQGPIGQAIGLFQSYQINLLQQALRHLGEGRTKTLAIMAGMQTTIYGASTLPGFDLINTHLIGSAAGNNAHADLHSLSYSIFGKEGAEWLMYGAPSNLLNASLYSRGNTNPRVWHIVPNPTNPTEIPFISAYAQAIGSMKATLDSISDGAPVWESFLSGVEHMGLSRPLAGIAASARAFTSPSGKAFTTQRSGSFLYENDLLSWTTLMRIAGAKPLDEAIMQNQYYITQHYARSDRQTREELGRAIKTTIQAGGVPDTEQIADFAAAYVSKGGSQQGFNSFFMSQYRNATQSQADQLAQRLSTPYGRRMQYMMGGSDILGEFGGGDY